MYVRCQSGGVKESDNPYIQDITHRIILGRTGVNKTVLLKSIIEDMVLVNIPVIALDPKVGLADMCTPKTLNLI